MPPKKAPKKKRVLTAAQREVMLANLAKGRAKRAANLKSGSKSVAAGKRSASSKSKNKAPAKIKKKRAPSKWMNAVKTWNYKTNRKDGKWCMPYRSTPAYNKVLSYM